MPDMRLTFVPHPVADKSADVCRRHLLDKDPVTDIAIVDEIIAALTMPLPDPETFPGTDRPCDPRATAPPRWP